MGIIGWILVDKAQIKEAEHIRELVVEVPLAMMSDFISNKISSRGDTKNIVHG